METTHGIAAAAASSAEHLGCAAIAAALLFCVAHRRAALTAALRMLPGRGEIDAAIRHTIRRAERLLWLTSGIAMISLAAPMIRELSEPDALSAMALWAGLLTQAVVNLWGLRGLNVQLQSLARKAAAGI